MQKDKNEKRQKSYTDKQKSLKRRFGSKTKAFWSIRRYFKKTYKKNFLHFEDYKS